MTGTRVQGSRWERAAETFLQGRGLRPVARNYNSRFGEIDLVMRDGPALVFVEVRYRRVDRYGSGADTVDWAKQRKLISAARHYLGRHPEARDLPCRFDVVSIGGGHGGPELNWIKDAFDAGS